MFLTPNSGSDMRFVMKNGGGEEILSTTAMTAGQWTHIALTLSNSTAVLYVDGAVAASSTSFSIKPSDFNPVLNYIGRSQYAGDSLFSGKIDDFRIYNVALSEASVSSLAAAAEASVPVGLINGDFDDSTAETGGGFDTGGYDVPGWTDFGTPTDAGIGYSNAWWLVGYENEYAAWMAAGDAAYTMSSYSIQDGDRFSVSFDAMWWTWTGTNGEWTATLFYDSPANVIGSFSSAALTDSWIAYSSPALIVAPPESVDGTLGILFESTGTGIAQLDEVAVSVTPDSTAPPAAPAGLAAVSGDTTVDLSWVADIADQAGFTVYRSVASSRGYAPVASGLATGAFADSGLLNGKRYYYVVTATGFSGSESADSEIVSAVPSVAVSDAEFVIGGVTVTGGSSLSMTVSNSVAGHAYTLLFSDTLTPPQWTTNTVESGTGSDLLFDVPMASTNGFFKLDVQRQ